METKKPKYDFAEHLNQVGDKWYCPYEDQKNARAHLSLYCKYKGIQYVSHKRIIQGVALLEVEYIGNKVPRPRKHFREWNGRVLGRKKIGRELRDSMD